MTRDRNGGAPRPPVPDGLTERLRQTTEGKSYAEVARLTGCNSETVRRYLNGGTPSVEFVAAVAGRFEVSADWLLLGRGPRRSLFPAGTSQPGPTGTGAGVQVRSGDGRVRAS